jgi:hypothetical protein
MEKVYPRCRKPINFRKKHMDIARFIARMERAPVFYRQDVDGMNDVYDLKKECLDFEKDFGCLPTGHISHYDYNYSSSNQLRDIKQYMKIWIIAFDVSSYLYHADTPGGERYCWSCNTRYKSTEENDFKYQLHLPRHCYTCENRTIRLRTYINANE